MSSPSTTLPSGWTFTDSTNTTATAPDGSTATGAVLAEVLSLVAEVATLQSGGTGGTGTGTITQAAFDALKAQVDTVVTAQTQAQGIFTALGTFAQAIAALGSVGPTHP